MKSILIKNANIVLKDKTVLGNVLLEDGIISKIGTFEASANIEIDAKENYLFSGFLDMHTHLREPGYEYKEDIKSGTKAAVKGGFTAVCCMPNTNPFIDNNVVVNYIINRALEENNCKVYPIGCITKGQNGLELAEMGLMKNAGAIAFSDDGKPVQNSNTMRLALEYAKTFNALLINHCEDLNLSDEGVANEGYNSGVIGLKGISKATEEIMVARDLLLAKTFDSKIHLAHISTKGSVELIRLAKKNGVKVTCETCPHYFSLTDDAIINYDTNAKVNPPLREKADITAIIQGLKDGTIDAIVTDHAPHGSVDKNVEFNNAANGISGLETAFSLSYTNLVKAEHITIEKLNELLSLNPAKILGLKAGIQEGYPADLTMVSLNEEITVDSKTFISKGKNTPFNGQKLFGNVLCTIVDGVVKYDKDKI